MLVLGGAMLFQQSSKGVGVFNQQSDESAFRDTATGKAPENTIEQPPGFDDDQPIIFGQVEGVSVWVQGNRAQFQRNSNSLPDYNNDNCRVAILHETMQRLGIHAIRIETGFLEIIPDDPLATPVPVQLHLLLESSESLPPPTGIDLLDQNPAIYWVNSQTMNKLAALLIAADQAVNPAWSRSLEMASHNNTLDNEEEELNSLFELDGQLYSLETPSEAPQKIREQEDQVEIVYETEVLTLYKPEESVDVFLRELPFRVRKCGNEGESSDEERNGSDSDDQASGQSEAENDGAEKENSSQPQGADVADASNNSGDENSASDKMEVDSNLPSVTLVRKKMSELSIEETSPPAKKVCSSSIVSSAQCPLGSHSKDDTGIPSKKPQSPKYEKYENELAYIMKQWKNGKFPEWKKNYELDRAERIKFRNPYYRLPPDEDLPESQLKTSDSYEREHYMFLFGSVRAANEAHEHRQKGYHQWHIEELLRQGVPEDDPRLIQHRQQKEEEDQWEAESRFELRRQLRFRFGCPPNDQEIITENRFEISCKQGAYEAERYMLRVQGYSEDSPEMQEVNEAEERNAFHQQYATREDYDKERHRRLMLAKERRYLHRDFKDEFKECPSKKHHWIMDEDEDFFRIPDIVPAIMQKQKQQRGKCYYDDMLSDEEAREKEKELPYSDSGEDDFSDQEAMERYCYTSEREGELACMTVAECVSRASYGGGYFSHLDWPIQKKK